MVPAADGVVPPNSPAVVDTRNQRVGAHGLLLANVVAALLLIGPLATPFLLAAGLTGPAVALYDAFHTLCHQWAFRSFFVLGPQAIYSRGELAALGVDPFTFVGEARTGWKMAFCEWNLAIVGGLFVFGVLYAARWRSAGLRPASWSLYAVLIAPMAIDGLSQLAGWRESTWELRLVTGALFGLAGGWVVYPRGVIGVFLE